MQHRIPIFRTTSCILPFNPFWDATPYSDIPYDELYITFQSLLGCNIFIVHVNILRVFELSIPFGMQLNMHIYLKMMSVNSFNPFWDATSISFSSACLPNSTFNPFWDATLAKKYYLREHGSFQSLLGCNPH